MADKSLKEKARYFTFLLYPESTPEDWVDRLETLDIPMAISPLHDKDVSPMGGYKKPHWHVIYVAKNPVTAESVRLRIKRLLGDKSLAKVQIVERGIESMYLYLTHESKDAIKKKKHVYPKAEIQLISNFDIDRYIVLDESDKKRLRKLVCSIIREQHIVNVVDLECYIDEHGKEYDEILPQALNEVLMSSTSLFRLYFDANYQLGFRACYTAHVNPETGEVIEPPNTVDTEPSESTQTACEDE